MTERWTDPDPARLAAALRLLDLCCEPGASVADLGCLHGSYTLEFARAGYEAAGIEVRPDSYAVCRDRAVPGCEFINDDVRNIAAHGPFDATFCCGLLYHLDEPVKYLRVLGEVTRKLLILQTHVSLAPDAENEEKAGHWYGEPPVSEQASAPWSSWGNERSFWLAKPDLIAAVQEAGFGLVLEVRDSQADVRGAPDRIMLAGVKTGE